MSLSDFRKRVKASCLYETIYNDSEGRQILVIRLLDAYVMVREAVQKERERNAQIADAHASIEGIAQKIAAEIRGQE